MVQTLKRVAILVSAALVVANCAHIRSRPTAEIPPFDVLVTDSPFSATPTQRAIIDRVEVDKLNQYQPRSYRLKGRSSGERIRVSIALEGQFVSVKGEVNSPNLTRSFTIRYLSSLVVKDQHLWLGTNYTHLDSAKSCFAGMTHPATGKGEISLIALGTGAAGDEIILKQINQDFTFDKASGRVEVSLGQGKSYWRSWQFSSKRRVTFQSRLISGATPLLEQSERVVAADPSSLARAMAWYYEVDEM
jgi:hypothetical protein